MTSGVPRNTAATCEVVVENHEESWPAGGVIPMRPFPPNDATTDVMKA